MNKFPVKPTRTKEEMVDRLKTLDKERYDLDEITASLHKRFGWVVFMRSVIPCSDGERILKKYIAKSKAKTALVIGTNRGVSTAFIAKHVEKVITIDIVDNKLKRKVWDHLRLTNIESVIVADNDEKKAYLEDLDFDFAFIDGDRNDYESDLKLTEKCGAVLIHEHAERKIPKKIKGETDNDFIFWTDKPHEADSSPTDKPKATKGTTRTKKKPGAKKGAKKKVVKKSAEAPKEEPKHEPELPFA